MKKLVLIITSFIVVMGLVACEEVCVGAECIVQSSGEPEEGTVVDNVVPFTHVNGHGEETEKNAFVLFEFQVRDYIKYQVSYLSCTCRDADYNYWNVMYVEINRYTNDIKVISFDEDGEGGHYSPGSWGDSSGAPEQAGITLEDFENDFIPWLIGKTSADLEGISVFTNEKYYDLEQNTTNIAEQQLIDDFAGSSVSSNNMIRVLKELLKYHEENYTE